MRMRHKNSGFTLIELMIVVVLLVIVATMAVPGFQGLIESNRLQSTTNDVLGILNYARSEAVRRGEPVAVRAAGGTLDEGLEVIYTDDGGNVEVLRESGPMPGSVTVSLQSGDLPVFKGNGMKDRNASDQSTLRICPGNGDHGADIVVNAGGQTNRSTNKVTCS